MYQPNAPLTRNANYKKFIAIAAFACTIFAGTLTAGVVKSEQPGRGLDPMIHAIIDAFEAGKPISAKDFTDTRTLIPRSKARKERVTVGDRSRLMVKFADELKVRITTNGQLVSRTNKSIDTVIETVQALGLTLSPTADVAESKVNRLIALAEARTGKQMPDIGGVFWVDGPLASVATAADVFFIMPEVEWLNAPPLHNSEKPYRGKKLEQARGLAFNPPTQRGFATVSPKSVGACMLRDGQCQESMPESSCIERDGTFLGGGSTCEASGGDEGGTQRGGAACCTVFACTDTDFTSCMDVNGVWFGAEGDLCIDIEGECPIGSEGLPTYALCPTLGDFPTYFSGDCYIDQNSQFVEDRHPFSSDFLPPITVIGTAGCLDASSFPNPQQGTISIEQDCCPDISEFVPSCGTDVWDHVCASYANSFDFENCLNPNICEDPFGPLQGPERQPIMLFTDDCPAGFFSSCWPFDESISHFTPQSTTPDYFKMGLQAWATDEPIDYEDWELSETNALAQLLPWPMGGAVIGEVSYLINGWPDTLPNLLIPPQTGVETEYGFEGSDFGIAQTMWDGRGLDLNPINPDADPGGMNASDRFSGLYGLGDWHEQLNAGPNGTYGAGVTVVVLDYAAHIQSYVITHEGVSTTYGSEHEELINIKLEGPETGHDDIRIYFDPTTLFPYSPHHGSAVLGVLGATWDPDDPDSNVGIRGLVPQADIMFFPLVAAIVDEDGVLHGEGRSGTAWINAMDSLEPGDVIAATYNPTGGQGGGLNNLDYNPYIHEKITVASALGFSVVIGAGMAGSDLSGAETPDGVDSGAIVAAAVSPGSSEDGNQARPQNKRYADGSRSSNYVAGDGGTYTFFDKVTCSAWGAGVTTCGFGPNQDNWFGYQTVDYSDECDYNIVAGRSYTNNFQGTSAASAIVAGCVVALQGFARQVFDTPLSPQFTRLYIGGGSYVGMTPDDPDVPGSGGNPIQSFPGSDTLSSENDVTGGGDTWDFVGTDAGTGNLVGNLANPWVSCQNVFVDPIFDTPSIDDIMIITGVENGSKNSGLIAAIDDMYFSVIPVPMVVGDHPMPSDYDGPGDHVTYLSTADITDIYLTGELRGGLSPGNILQWNVVMLDSSATSTILLVYMFDFSRRDWVQASTSELLTAADVNPDTGKIEVEFIVPRASRMINQLGEYHARFVTISQSDGDDQYFPYFYDQIRLNSASFPGPIVMP